jgi:hypothetical protein
MVNIIRLKLRKFVLFIVLLFVISIFIPTASAGEDANLDSELSLSATPPRQGMGGPITITIEATFYGGCCYALYAKDVVPEVILPRNVELVEPISPNKIGKFEATAGGGPVAAEFKCIVTSVIPGEYTIKAKVTTSNCGDAEGSVQITFSI